MLNRGGVRKFSFKHVPAATYSISASTLSELASQNFGVNGSGIGVAVIDSGIASSKDFAKSIVYSQDFTGGDGQDLYGHGTQVAGIIGGGGSNSHCTMCYRNLQGMAPNANLIDLRVLDASGDSRQHRDRCD